MSAPTPAAIAAAKALIMKYVDSFMHNLKILARDMTTRFPNDATVYRAEKRIMAGISLDPLYIITTVGQYLYTYRNLIYSPDADATEKFFLENTFDTELKESVNAEKADLVSYIIPRVKDAARGMKSAEKESYKNLVVELLDDYIEFLAASVESKS